MIENLNIETIETENDEMVFLTPVDVAKALGCSVPMARSLFYREDFPGLKIGKKLAKSCLVCILIPLGAEKRLSQVVQRKTF